MQKARLLMDENSVSFQMFLILLSSMTLCSESQIPVFKKVRAILRSLFCFVCLCGGSMRSSQNLGKKNFIRHFARFNFSRLSLAFILKYYPILHAVKR